jgi:hypothetical protein
MHIEPLCGPIAFIRTDFMTTISFDPHDDAAPAAANAAANGVPHLKTSDEPIRLVPRHAGAPRDSTASLQPGKVIPSMALLDRRSRRRLAIRRTKLGGSYDAAIAAVTVITGQLAISKNVALEDTAHAMIAEVSLERVTDAEIFGCAALDPTALTAAAKSVGRTLNVCAAVDAAIALARTNGWPDEDAVSLVTRCEVAVDAAVAQGLLQDGSRWPDAKALLQGASHD